MKVRVIPHASGSNVNGNIMWPGEGWPMRGGKFPAEHPCVADPKPSTLVGDVPESETPIGKFRAAGYWASCFPEGDGITYRAERGQSDEQQRKDVEECFGWTIVERFA